MAVLPELLERNLKTMERSQAKLAARLREYVQGLDAFPEPTIQETSAGRWISGLTERPFFEPVVEDSAHRRISKGSVYLVYGVGCPPYLFHILRNLPRETLAVIVIEPSVSVLLHTLASTSVFMAIPQGCRISFITYDDLALIDEASWHNITPLGIFPLSEAIPIVHRGLEEVRNEPERLAEKRFREVVIYRLTALGNSPEDTLLGIRHGALNVPRILKSPSFSELKKQFGGKPFVCVASGPSLDKNVHLLKGMEDRCVIAACDTVLLPLLRRGIRPHVVTTIERPLITYETWVPPVLEEFFEECREVLLLSQSVSHPLIAGRWPGPNIIVGKIESPADTWLVSSILRKTIFASGMSVAHMNLSLGVAMDAPAVALIGQDLAYAEDQRTHVSGAVSEGIVAIERSRERIEIPGALGGTVQTHKLWLHFLQIFERQIASYGDKSKICDCTEGGALIQGTEVLPFGDFLKREVAPQASFVWNREALKRWNGERIDAPGVLSRINVAFAALDQCDSYLDRMAEGIRSATAPALLPEKRRESAFKVAGFLDDCHRAHPVLAFIGQSYTHLAGASLAVNRFMETVEQVKEWRELHEEIIQSHRANVAFLRQWLEYVKSIVSLPDQNLSGENVDLEEGLPQLLDSFFNRENVNMLSGEALRVSEILCHVDPALDEHDPTTCWKAARFLFAQGRAFEARRIMKNVYGHMEGTNQPSCDIAEFFLEWARMEKTHDLCVTPNFEKAIELLSSAVAFDPSIEGEAGKMHREILEDQRQYYSRYRELNASKDAELSVLLYRNRAAEALSRHDLPETFEWIWKLVDAATERFPGNSLPNARWLLDTAMNCRCAVDPDIARASKEALSRLWGKRAALENAGFRWPATMMEYLRETGLQVSLDEADKIPRE